MARSATRLAAAILAAAVALAGPPAWAQDTATSTELTITRERKPPTSATPEMIAEAIERSQARTRRLLSEGVPEEFGSEDSTFSLSTTELGATVLGTTDQ